jgi:hypothetical protein
VLLLYEEVMQTDFVSSFDETQTFKTQLAAMLPPTHPHAPWDTDKKYSIHTVQLWYETPKGDRIEVPLSTSLADLINFKSPPFVVPGFPTFFVTAAAPLPAKKKKNKKKK